MYLIGVRNLVIEVDARYIKGMLANPDLNPWSSINRWILSILTFHFTLVHVPGTFHGPDGMSRRQPQPGDIDEVDNGFDDWIDQLYGFMHMINDPTSTLAEGSDLSILTMNAVDASTLEDENQTLTYNDVPRSTEARQADNRLLLVRNWLDTLTRPTDMSNADYATFMGYCQSFFIASSKLWRKNSQGYHKLVVVSDSRIEIL